MAYLDYWRLRHVGLSVAAAQHQHAYSYRY